MTISLRAERCCWELKYEALCARAAYYERTADRLELRSPAMVRRCRCLANYYRCRAHRLYCCHCQHACCPLNSIPP
ncbi:MAG: hypothetical protein JSR80_00165 [Verrucomicrobia bacterium]|nr:hypothetical protein [Verrucomicrobiota bacterium]